MGGGAGDVPEEHNIGDELSKTLIIVVILSPTKKIAGVSWRARLREKPKKVLILEF